MHNLIPIHLTHFDIDIFKDASNIFQNIWFYHSGYQLKSLCHTPWFKISKRIALSKKVDALADRTEMFRVKAVLRHQCLLGLQLYSITPISMSVWLQVRFPPGSLRAPHSLSFCGHFFPPHIKSDRSHPVLPPKDKRPTFTLI